MLLTAKEYWFKQAKEYLRKIQDLEAELTNAHNQCKLLRGCLLRDQQRTSVADSCDLHSALQVVKTNYEKIEQENSWLKQQFGMPSTRSRPRVVQDEVPEVEHLDDKEDMEGQEQEVEEEEEKLLPFPWQKHWDREYSTWYYHNVQDGSSVWAQDFVAG